MTTMKGLVKKAFTLNGILKLIAIMFVLNLTTFGRAIREKIGSLFRKGMGGI